MEFSPRIRNQVWLGAFSLPEEKTPLADPSILHDNDPYEPIHQFWEGRPSQNSSSELQDFYIKFYLEGDILVKTDRASMAHALEVRSPLLDDELSSVIRSMPQNLKLRHGKTKYLFKNVMRRFLPAAIVDRPKKGFGIPVAHWIRGDLKKNFEEALGYDRIKQQGLFNPQVVQRLLKEHQSGQRDNRKQLWTLYVFQKWRDNWL
jgi:asparagine synthase (glutamine-hydrolysing)